MIDLQEEYNHLLEEIRIGSIADHELQITEFFRIYSMLGAENGDTPDMEYCPVLKEGTSSYRVDGFAVDILDGGDGESGDLYLAVCDYRQDEEIPNIVSKDIDRAVDGIERFFKLSMSRQFLDSLEESSYAYQLAILIQQYRSRIRRLRVIYLTNGRLSIRKSIFETREIGDITIHINILDLDRYSKISSTGGEPVEVDFHNDFAGAIECLPASVGADSYQSYLFAMPGTVLAEVFAAFGNRLLEQNVRTYLQAKTGVNKGILRTIADEPHMFFAYNNGVTATASTVKTQRLANGTLAISSIKDFQIVNGGQTTASLLYARDSQNKKLDQVHVQVKLSVVDESLLADVVPRISEYANTQNKVSLADLASNSPIQIRIERFSKEISVPQKLGELHSSKWFYERARGQYKNLFSYKSPSERKKLELTYPKSRLVTKTDLAKYELSFEGRPHHVSEGAQKCFNRYTMTVLSKLGDGSSLNETWFRRAMAKAILFIGLDEAIQKSSWYQGDRGYKSQIVTYTIAACAEGFRSIGQEIDLEKIWKEQDIPIPLLKWMLDEAQLVANILKTPPDNVRNISEYAKREFCWEHHVKGKTGVPTKITLQYTVSKEDFSLETRQGTREATRNLDVEFDVMLFGLVTRANDIIELAKKSGIASPKNISALTKVAAGRLTLTKGEKIALKDLLDRLDV